MNLYEKICLLYPTLTNDDFIPQNKIIILQNNGEGDYIAEWNHPILTKPTTEQLT